jgi:4-aminobutyrate aminotransferase/(S)-3-amino-2-methylpropionate transaminase
MHGVSVEQSLAGIQQLFKADVDPALVAAILIEPVQGEGGYYVAPFELLQALRKLCDEHGILLISDEVQTGFARTGKMFAIEHSGVVPDLIATAKSLAGGFPLSVVIGKAEIMDKVNPGGLGGTYAGSPIGCAAGLAVIQAIEEEGLLARSTAVGEKLSGRLVEMARRNRFSCIGEVRHLGGMVAFELVKDRATNTPDPDLTRKLAQTAAANGLILLSCGVYANVIRIMVPLTASDAILDEGLDKLEASLDQALG